MKAAITIDGSTNTVIRWIKPRAKKLCSEREALHESSYNNRWID